MKSQESPIAPIEKNGGEENNKLFELTGKRVRVAAIAGLFLLSGVGTGSAQHEDVESPTTTTSMKKNGKKDNRSAVFEEKEGENLLPSFESLNVRHTFIVKNEKTGEYEMNWWGFLAPFQIELGWTKEIVGNATIKIPYEYSRLFDSGKPLRKRDHEKLSAFIDQQIKRELASMIYGLSNSKRVHEAHNSNPDLSKLKIIGMKVVGTTSPEGPAEKGPDTLAPDNIDSENLKLAILRGATSLGYTEKSLKHLKAKLSNEVLNQAKSKIEGQEIQFSTDEMRELSKLAQNYRGVDELEQIYHMVVDYNNGKIKDKETNSKLDTIINSKRSVKISIEYEGNQHKILLIPFPLLLFLFLIPPPPPPEPDPSNSDKTQKTPSGEGPKPKTPIDQESPVETTTPKILVEKPPKGFSGYLEKIPLPEGEEAEKIEEETWIRDLFVFFDRKETINRGLDYKAISDSVFENYDKFFIDEKTERETEISLTYLILKQWREHDIAARFEAGIDRKIEEGLNYLDDSKQIRYARMHAKAIMELVKMKKTNPNIDYIDLMSKKIRLLIIRERMRNN